MVNKWGLSHAFKNYELSQNKVKIKIEQRVGNHYRKDAFLKLKD